MDWYLVLEQEADSRSCLERIPNETAFYSTFYSATFYNVSKYRLCAAFGIPCTVLVIIDIVELEMTQEGSVISSVIYIKYFWYSEISTTLLLAKYILVEDCHPKLLEGMPFLQGKATVFGDVQLGGRKR